jgi:hypothetical protein
MLTSNRFAKKIKAFSSLSRYNSQHISITQVNQVYKETEVVGLGCCKL